MTTSEPIIPPPESSTSSPGASRASRPRRRGSAKAKRTPAGSGPSSCVWCERPAPCGCWRKMFGDSVVSSLPASVRSSVNWKRAVTPSGRVYTVLGRSEPRTRGTGSGSSDGWPTPQRADGERASNMMVRGNPTLKGAVNLWPTPAQADASRGASKGGYPTHTGGPNLSGAAKSAGPPVPENRSMSGSRPAWPTPQAYAHDPALSNPPGRTPLDFQAGGKLNAAWVEILQGFPSGWTDVF